MNTKSNQYYDISEKIGSLWHSPTEPEWPMYSFDRPSYYLWNSLAKALDARGWTEEQIKTWLQSKGPRWALDGDLGEAIEKLGRDYARNLKPWGED